MPEQFTVPQFIDSEDKILGPVTIRQFVIMVIVFMTDAVLYKMMPFTYFLLIAIPLVILGGVVAFVKINGMPFHYFILNLIQTLKRPGLRIWDKSLNEAEIKAYIKVEPEVSVVKIQHKQKISRSRLDELSLVVNTGGSYQPDEE